MYNKKDKELEKICKKLNKIPLDEWHNEEKYFYTQKEGLTFCLSGYYDDDQGASEVSLHVLDAGTEKVIKEYAAVPKLHKKFKGLMKRETKLKTAEAKKHGKKLLEDFVKE